MSTMANFYFKARKLKKRDRAGLRYCAAFFALIGIACYLLLPRSGGQGAGANVVVSGLMIVLSIILIVASLTVGARKGTN